jgi:hypothetical protein
MRYVATCLLAAALFSSPVLSIAQAAGSSTAAAPSAQSEVTFQIVRPGLQVPRFTLRVREDGTGSYQAEQAAKSQSDTAIPAEAAQHIDRTFTLSSIMAKKIFNAAHGAGRFNIACASKAKNIANTGAKTLSYSGSDGSGSCVYNYTENKTVLMLTDAFLGIAYTMDEGRRLDYLHRYDRLGLDAEMDVLSQEMEAGRALELGTISTTLAAIANDTAVMERVRLKAATMLAHAKESR